MKTTNLLSYRKLHPVIEVIAMCPKISNDDKFKAVMDVVKMVTDPKYGIRVSLSDSLSDNQYSPHNPIVSALSWSGSKLGVDFWRHLSNMIDRDNLGDMH